MDFDWPEGWFAASEKDAPALERELANEIGYRHVLRGQQVTLLARRFDQDEALFALGDGRIAQVHLSWNGREADPSYPWTEVFDSLADWQANWIVSDN